MYVSGRKGIIHTILLLCSALLFCFCMSYICSIGNNGRTAEPPSYLLLLGRYCCCCARLYEASSNV